jgi:hypothetical protein
MEIQATMLGIESQQVIMLRLAKLAAGDSAASAEAGRMVTEKVHAMADCGHLLLRAAIDGHPNLGADKIIRRYRKAVRANRRRLSK